jgi:hypothetical protein
MAELWALLPAPAATAIYTAVDLPARRPGLPAGASIDARRADALLEPPPRRCGMSSDLVLTALVGLLLVLLLRRTGGVIRRRG